LSDADELTPMGTEFRYPDDFDEINDLSQLFPTVEEVEAAIVQAKRILDFIKSKIAGIVDPAETRALPTKSCDCNSAR